MALSKSEFVEFLQHNQNNPDKILQSIEKLGEYLTSRATACYLRGALESAQISLELIKDQEGFNLLHAACFRGSVKTVATLLELSRHPSDYIQSKDNKKRCPLHYATIHGRIDVIKKLLEFAQSVDILNLVLKARDANQQNALDIALSHDEPSVWLVFHQSKY